MEAGSQWRTLQFIKQERTRKHNEITLGLARRQWDRQPDVPLAQLTFPGSSFGRGVFTKHLLSDKLCLMEF
jgi:hypothetical protein